MMALTWSDIDLETRQICVQGGHVMVPRGGRLRYVPMTSGSRPRYACIGICTANASSASGMLFFKVS